jgi:DNA-binding transcriptional regulator YiaG
MTSLHNALKSEIAPIAREEHDDELLALRRVTAAHRAEIAALKRDLLAIRSLVQLNERAIKKVVPASQSTPEVHPPKSVAFNAQALADKRAKLGLSQSDLAKLLEATSLSVYKWESGKVQPRAAQLSRIAAIQKIGKSEAVARLAKYACRDNYKVPEPEKWPKGW